MLTTAAVGGMTINEFRRYYGAGRSKTYELINTGAIVARKLGRKTLIDRASAEHWYRSLPIVGGLSD